MLRAMCVQERAPGPPEAAARQCGVPSLDPPGVRDRSYGTDTWPAGQTPSAFRNAMICPA